MIWGEADRSHPGGETTLIFVNAMSNFGRQLTAARRAKADIDLYRRGSTVQNSALHPVEPRLYKSIAISMIVARSYQSDSIDAGNVKR
jgi:hypothetical protein